MSFTLRRLVLGIALNLASSGVLLLLDLDHRNPSALPATCKWKVTMIQYNQVLDVEESEKGVLAGLRESKLQDAEKIQVEGGQKNQWRKSSFLKGRLPQGYQLLRE